MNYKNFNENLKSFIIKNKNYIFIIGLFIAIIIAFLFSYYSAQGFDIKPVIIIPAFLTLIYFNVVNAPKNYKRAILYIFIISTSFQVYLAADYYGWSWDINAARNWAIVLDNGLNPFNYEDGTIDLDYYPADHFMPPNLPAIVLGSYAVLKLSQITNIPYSTLSHFPSIIATLIIGILLMNFMRYKGKKDNEIFKILAFYLYNPIVLMASGYQSTWDNVAIVLLFAYLLYMQKNKIIKPLSHLIYGISLMIKHMGIFQFPYFLSKQKSLLDKAVFIFLALSPFLLLTFFFMDFSLVGVANDLITQSGENPISYTGVKYVWSYSRIEMHLTTSVFNLPQVHDFFAKVYPIITLFMFLIMFIYFYKNKHINYLDGIIMSFLFYYVINAGFGLHYVMWILPFAVLRLNIFYYLYTALASAMLLLAYYGNANEFWFVRDAIGISIFGEILWAVTIIWFIWYLRKISKNKASLT
jgi:hypothetical protein